MVAVHLSVSFVSLFETHSYDVTDIADGGRRTITVTRAIAVVTCCTTTSMGESM